MVKTKIPKRYNRDGKEKVKAIESLEELLDSLPSLKCHIEDTALNMEEPYEDGKLPIDLMSIGIPNQIFCSQELIVNRKYAYHVQALLRRALLSSFRARQRSLPVPALAQQREPGQRHSPSLEGHACSDEHNSFTEREWRASDVGG